MIELLAIFISLYMIIKISLDLYQIKYIQDSTVSYEKLECLNVDKEYFDNSKLYNIDKLKISIINSLLQSTIVIYFVFFDGISILKKISISLNYFDFNNDLFLITIFIFFIILINLPISWYKTLKIEEKYGFNKVNSILFFKDNLISLILSIFIASFLFTAFSFLFYNFSDNWWLYMWAVFIVFNILIIYLYPTLISPIFNSFEKVSDKEIINMISNLSIRTEFNVSNIYVMDGSRRSGHSNAYFTGFFNNKRIVFFDTLLDLLSPKEVESVLAHEIGHYKKKHIMKSFLISLFTTFSGFYLLFSFLSFNELFDQISLDINSSSEVAIFYILISPIIIFFISPLFSSISRKHEFEADNYAKEFSDKESMISSLKKLYKANLTLVDSSPIYSSIYYSHPTVFERINNLQLKNDK